MFANNGSAANRLKQTLTLVLGRPAGPAHSVAPFQETLPLSRYLKIFSRNPLLICCMSGHKSSDYTPVTLNDSFSSAVLLQVPIFAAGTTPETPLECWHADVNIRTFLSSISISLFHSKAKIRANQARWCHFRLSCDYCGDLIFIYLILMNATAFPTQ